MVGAGFTASKKLPVISAAVAVQFASLKAITVKVVEPEEFTLTLYGLEETTKGHVNNEALSCRVKCQGPVPVKVTGISAESPPQIVVVPPNTAVGLGFTVILITFEYETVQPETPLTFRLYHVVAVSVGG
jgi:hypothetical protein